MTYEGSTTHPGCWETAVWLILNKPIYITAREVNTSISPIDRSHSIFYRCPMFLAIHFPSRPFKFSPRLLIRKLACPAIVIGSLKNNEGEAIRRQSCRIDQRIVLFSRCALSLSLAVRPKEINARPFQYAKSAPR